MQTKTVEIDEAVVIRGCIKIAPIIAGQIEAKKPGSREQEEWIKIGAAIFLALLKAFSEGKIDDEQFEKVALASDRIQRCVDAAAVANPIRYYAK